ncbi:MAG: signal peptidase I [Desulfovermiculus sp.]
MGSKWSDTLKEYAQALIIALILAFVIRSFVVQAFKIPSGSMLPTLEIGDHLLVNKFIYGIKLPFTEITIVPVSEPETGDIVVFKFPEDESKDFIKRVIGVPGDTILIKDKQVYRNGELLPEPYAQRTSPQLSTRAFPLEKWPPHEFDPRARDNLGPIQVPEDAYFVLGDNRDESYDSRFWGFVREEAILGQAWIIYWSWEGLTNIRWGRIGDTVE